MPIVDPDLVMIDDIEQMKFRSNAANSPRVMENEIKFIFNEIAKV